MLCLIAVTGLALTIGVVRIIVVRTGTVYASARIGQVTAIRKPVAALENILINHGSVDVEPDITAGEIVRAILIKVIPLDLGSRRLDVDDCSGWDEATITESDLFLQRKIWMTSLRNWVERSVDTYISGRSLAGVSEKNGDEKWLVKNSPPVNFGNSYPSSLIQMVSANAGLNRLFGRFDLGIGSRGGVTGSMADLFGNEPESNIRNSQYASYQQAGRFKEKPQSISSLLTGFALLLVGFAGLLCIYFGLWASQFPKYHWLLVAGLISVGMIFGGCAVNAAGYFFYIAMQHAD